MSKPKDPIQLQQKIIHFKSELAKYKEKVKDYQENYHYALLEKLKNENAKLLENQQELQKDRNVISGEFHKRIQGLEEQLEEEVKLQKELVREIETWREKANRERENFQDASQRVVALQKESSTLQHRFKQKQEEFEKTAGEFQKLQKQSHEKEAGYQARIQEYEGQLSDLKNRLEEMEKNFKEQKTINHEQDTLMKQITERKALLEDDNEKLNQNVKRYLQEMKQLRNLLVDAEEKLNEQNASQTESLKNKKEEMNHLKQRNRELTDALNNWEEKHFTFQRHEKVWKKEKEDFEKHQKELKEELEEKANSIIILKESNEKLKKQNEKILGYSSEGDEKGGPGNLLSLLDQQMRNILGQTFEYEEQLDSKMIQMKTLEEKIEQLGTEILQLEEGEDETINIKDENIE